MMDFTSRPCSVNAEQIGDLGLIDRLPKNACAQAERANPSYLSFQTGSRELRPVAAQATLASAVQIGDPVSYEEAVKTLAAFGAVVEQASERS